MLTRPEKRRYTKNAAFGGLAAPHGDFYLVLEQNTKVAQTFHVEKGAFYVLSFYLASRPLKGMDTLEIYLDAVLTCVAFVIAFVVVVAIRRALLMCGVL